MEKRFITTAMRELRAAITEAENLSAKEDLSKREEQRINVLLAKIAALRSGAVAPDDFQKRWFRTFFQGGTPTPESRATDVLAGTQSFTLTAGSQGGFLVPTEFNQEVIYGLAQYDPLLDDDVCTVIRSKNFSLRPFKVPGWDLSTFAAQRVTEANQFNPQTVPSATSNQLNGYMYRATLDDTLEFEDDVFEPAMSLFADAFSIGLARGIGVDLVNGTGSGQPQGILTGAANSGITTATAGKITQPDVTAIYFSVNKAYRNSPKCGWLMNDVVYGYVLNAVDNSGRPLLNYVADRELLFGKPVYICPSLPSTSASHGIVFGDLSRFVVRASAMTLSRDAEASGYIDKGKFLYNGRMRIDSAVVDPTAGSKPPIVYATLK